jgi:hypothetical protein
MAACRVVQRGGASGRCGCNWVPGSGGVLVGVSPWRVFLSHTSELREHPQGGSFIDALETHRVDEPWEHGVGAVWEQLRALNMPERSSMDLNGTAPTCKSLIFAGQRGIGAIVHTEGVLEPTSTALNCAKRLVNGPTRLQSRPSVEPLSA